jgi:hypothetical protein
MFTQVESTDIPRERVITALIQLRQDWQTAAGPRSLAKTKGNVGFILSDFAAALGLGAIDRIRVLGVELTQDIDDVLNTTCELR